MDLWIRSQDRQDLIKVDGRFHVQETRVNPHSHKWGILIDGHCFYAEYSTEERAIEILDEIQSFIDNNYEQDLSSYGNNMIANGRIVLKTRQIVYELPKE